MMLTANACSPGPAPWRCADCACPAANALCRTARPPTTGSVRSDRVRFGQRADARGLRPARWLLASALPFHLFDAFLQRRVLLAQLFDVRQQPVQTCSFAHGHAGAVIGKPCRLGARSACLGSPTARCRQAVCRGPLVRLLGGAIGVRRLRAAAQAARGALRGPCCSRFLRAPFSAPRCPRKCRRRVRGSSGYSLRWLFLVSLLKRCVPGCTR
jgi:hypothetical protein